MSTNEAMIIQEVQQFQQSFPASAELDIIALTGADSASYSRMGNEQTWMATISVTAWHVQDQADIQQGAFILVNKDEEKKLEQLFDPMEANQIWKMKVRRDQNRLLLLKLDQLVDPAQEPQLAPILKEQTREVTIEHERLGTFVLDRSLNSLRGNIEWLGETIRVSLDNDADAHHQLNVLARLIDDDAKWDRRIRAFAAEELTELKNDSWLEDDEEEWSEANFAKQLTLQAITFTEEDFTFWFDDGDLFWGHAIYVSNTIEDGPYDANIGG